MKIAQQLCPEGVCGPMLHNTCEKTVWGLRPHTFSHFCCTSSAPRPPPDTFVCTIFILWIFRVVPGDDYYKITPLAVPVSGRRVGEAFWNSLNKIPREMLQGKGP